MACKHMNIWCIYEVHMNPALSGSSALLCVKLGDALEIRDRKIFYFYLGLPHMLVWSSKIFLDSVWTIMLVHSETVVITLDATFPLTVYVNDTNDTVCRYVRHSHICPLSLFSLFPTPLHALILFSDSVLLLLSCPSPSLVPRPDFSRPPEK